MGNLFRNPPIVKPTPPPPRVVQFNVLATTDPVVSLVVEGHPSQCRFQRLAANGGAVFCELDPKAPAPFGALLSIAADGYVPIVDRFVEVGMDLDAQGQAIFPDNIADVTMEEIPTRRPLPPVPNRDQVCGIVLNWQGLTVAGEPWFDIDIAYRPDHVRREAYEAKRQPRPGAPNGDTHLMLHIDMTGLACLPKLKALAREYLAEQGGTGIQLMCCGDGNEAGKENHDPGSLNWPWLMANFRAIYDFWKADEDLTPYTVFVPGFDGVVPGWQPFTRVNEFARMARAVIDAGGSGYLGIELAAGYWCWSGETNDWETADGQKFDVIIQEFPIGVEPAQGPPKEWLKPDGSWKDEVSNEQRNPWTQVYQILARMVPNFSRPADYPRDDMGATYQLGRGTPRGPFYYIAGEIDTYLWKRQSAISVEKVDANRRALLAMGCRYVG